MVLILTFVSFYSMGCLSEPVPVSHSFARSGSQAAKIQFEGSLAQGGEGVDFVDFDGAKLPWPKVGTYWASHNMNIAFPAGEPLELKVRAYHFTNIMPMLHAGTFCMQTMILAPIGFVFYGLALVIDLPIGIALNFDKRVVFECPPLETGGNYILKVRRKSKEVNRALVLTYADTDTVVYEQEF